MMVTVSHPSSDFAMPVCNAEFAHRAPARVVRMIPRHADRARIGSRCRTHCELLAALVANVAGARLLEPQLLAGAAPYVFPLWVEEPERSLQALRRASRPIFRRDVHRPRVLSLTGDQGLQWARHVFQLGCHQELSDSDIRQIASTVEAPIDARP
jgi:hypothetical protein